MIFSGSKTGCVLFASALLDTLGYDSLLITITKQEKSGDYCVRIVIDILSDATVVNLARDFSLKPINISRKITQAGLPLPRRRK